MSAVSAHPLPPKVAEARDRVREFVREVVIPEEPRPGDRLAPSRRTELQAAARAANVFAPHVPREYGGLGVPLEHWSPILQEAGYSPIGPAALNCMAPDEGNMHLLREVANPAQIERYLRPLAAGAIRSCFGMTEPHPGAGSDPAALRTTARKVEDGWVVDGEKRFASGADGAEFCVLMARTPAIDGHRAGATMLLVPMSTPGVRPGPAIHTLDRTIDGGHPHVRFEECFVPDDAVLGAPGEGFRYAQVRLGPARLTHCMRWLGLARRALDVALDRIEQREVFGAPLRDHGLAQHLVSRAVIDVETSDAIITSTSHRLVTDGRAGTAMSSVAKVHVSEAVSRIIDSAIQLCGGDGVSDGLPLAQYANEVRPFRIYDGATETHLWAIARRTSEARRKEVAAGARSDVLGGSADTATTP